MTTLNHNSCSIELLKWILFAAELAHAADLVEGEAFAGVVGNKPFLSVVFIRSSIFCYIPGCGH
jgi:hypothetical protein